MSTRKLFGKCRSRRIPSGSRPVQPAARAFLRRPQVEMLESRTLLSVGTGEVALLDAARLSELVAEGLLIPADRGSYRIAGGVNSASLALNEDAAVTTNADELWSGGSLGLSLTGSGLTVGIWDEGAVRSTHEAIENRVTVVDNADQENHSTHVAGTIAGDGVDEPDAHGMATAISIRSRTWEDDRIEFPSDASSNLIDLSNHSYANLRGWTIAISWGGLGNCDTWVADRDNFTEDPFFGKYEENPNSVDASLHAMDMDRIFSAHELDEALHDYPQILAVWAAGNDANDEFENRLGTNQYVTYRSDAPGGANWYLVSTGDLAAPDPDGEADDGYDSLPQTQTAKNSLVVGSIYDLSEEYSAEDIEISEFSSRGGTDDGRIKPDIVGNGQYLLSSGAASDDAYYSDLGTSMAAPNVTGTAALLMEHYEDTFGELPLSATTKAVVIHTAADDADLSGPDYTYGWGVLDAEAAAEFITDAADAQSDSYDSIEELAYDGSEGAYFGAEVWTQAVVSRGEEPLKVTIAWTDPEGTAHGAGLDISTSVLVNDLDLWITNTAETPTYYRPWVLDPSEPDDEADCYVGTDSDPDEYSNDRDNVEQVLIDSPAAGTYIIHVGHHGTLQDDAQDVSIMISGGTDTLYWNETGDDDWSSTNWEDGEGDALDVFPNHATLDVVVRTDTVTVTEDRKARDLDVTSGTIEIQQGDTLALAGDLDIDTSAEFLTHLGDGTIGLIDAAGDVTLGASSTLTFQAHGDDMFTDDTLTLIDGDSHTGTFGTVDDLDAYVTGSGVSYSSGTISLTLNDDLWAADADFSNTCDLSDYNIWNAYKFTSPTIWREADFNGSGATDLSDYNIWNANKFTSGYGRGSAPVGGTASIDVLYNAQTGKLTVDTDGSDLVTLLIAGPEANRIDRWDGKDQGMFWEQAYFEGSEQWRLVSGILKDGTYGIASYDTGLAAADFGTVEFFAAGGVQYTTVTVLSPTPPPVEAVDQAIEQTAAPMDLSLSAALLSEWDLSATAPSAGTGSPAERAVDRLLASYWP